MNRHTCWMKHVGWKRTNALISIQHSSNIHPTFHPTCWMKCWIGLTRPFRTFRYQDNTTRNSKDLYPLLATHRKLWNLYPLVQTRENQKYYSCFWPTVFNIWKMIFKELFTKQSFFGRKNKKAYSYSNSFLVKKQLFPKSHILRNIFLANNDVCTL